MKWMNEHWEKPIWVLVHTCYFILFLPGKQSLHNFDQAAGSEVIIEGSMVEVLWLKTNPCWVHDTKYLLPTKVTYSYILFKYMYLWTDFQGVLQMVEQHSMTGQNVCMPSCCSAFDYGKVHQGSLSRSALFLVWSFHPNTFSGCGSFVGDGKCTLIKFSNWAVAWYESLLLIVYRYVEYKLSSVLRGAPS